MIFLFFVAYVSVKACSGNIYICGFEDHQEANADAQQNCQPGDVIYAIDVCAEGPYGEKGGRGHAIVVAEQ